MSNLKDFATATVVTGPSPDTSGTTLVVQAGMGDRFPETPFYITAHPDGQLPTLDNAEKLQVTEVDGDTMTIVRAQGDTTAKPIAAGWRVSNTIFAADLESSGSGDVAGPSSSVDNALPRFDGTTGKLVQGSALTLSDLTSSAVTLHPIAQSTPDTKGYSVNIIAGEGNGSGDGGDIYIAGGANTELVLDGSAATAGLYGPDGVTIEASSGGAVDVYGDTGVNVYAGTGSIMLETTSGVLVTGAALKADDVAEVTADAGVTIEGVLLKDGDVRTGGVVRLSGAGLLQNTRVKQRVGSTASSATPTINTDQYDQFNITALATNITSMTTNLSGNPNDGDRLLLRIKDNGTARTIAWGSSFISSGVAELPTTTAINKTHTVGFIYDAAAGKWVCMAVDAAGY